MPVHGDRMIKLNINSRTIEVEQGSTVLEAALRAGIYIPNLCYHPDLPPIGACRLCIIEIEGIKGFPASCTTQVKEGMVVHTDTSSLRELRKNVVGLLLSEHPKELERSSQLEKVVEYVGRKEVLPGDAPHTRGLSVISDEPLFIRDLDRCILCGRCTRICQEVRKIGTIGFIDRGVKAIVGTGYNVSMKDAACKFCLACVEVCPSGALVDKEKFEEEDREKVLLPCTNTCPAGIEVSRYVRLIAEGRFQDALEVIREKVPFPLVLGYVCDHPCEEACRRCEVNEPIAIKMLKRFVAEQDSGRWRRKITVLPETGKKIAIVGSGPAGLTAAWFLRIEGHSVTVFEEQAAAGGMMRTAIPRYRLPGNILDREIKEIENIGVEIKTDIKIESLDELFEQGYCAVFLALGAAEGMKMGISGEEDRRVLDGISMLQSINLGKETDIAGEVAVVGGGNVAIDAARSALRAGAKKVTILYRRTREEMPAASEEIEEALEEGVEITFLVAPRKVFSEGGRLKIECIRMELGEPDASGRRRPVPVEGSEFIIEVDRLIPAIGQRSVLPEELSFLADKKGKISADTETAACCREGVFAGGDVVSGPASVIEAIQAGRKGAISIDKYLGGEGRIDKQFIPEEEEDLCMGREEGFAYRERAVIPVLPVDKRMRNFRQVEICFDKKTATKEAERCLKCQLRLKISEIPLPPPR